MFDDEIVRAAAALVQLSVAKGAVLATAESCTGGLVAASLTEIPGSSAVLDRGFVTYSNDAKIALLDVPPALIDQHGAVSEAVAAAMAAGALARSHATLTVAITGIAGPGGGSLEKPVGLVHFATATPAGVICHAERYGDLGRSHVRRAALLTALKLLEQRLV